MKLKFLLTSLLVAAFIAGNAQQQKPGDGNVMVSPESAEAAPGTEEVFTVVEEMPEFPGGMHKMYEFVAQNITYPQNEKEAGIQGKVYVKFVVEKDGTIGNVQVLRGVTNGKALDDEAVRVIKAMPRWIPGKQSGKIVSVYYNLPISFKLEDGNKKDKK